MLADGLGARKANNTDLRQHKSDVFLSILTFLLTSGTSFGRWLIVLLAISHSSILLWLDKFETIDGLLIYADILNIELVMMQWVSN